MGTLNSRPEPGNIMPKGFTWKRCMREVGGQVRKKNPRASRASVKGQAERICGSIHAKDLARKKRRR